MGAPKGHANYNTELKGGSEPLYDKNYLDALADEFLEWYKDDKNIWFFRFFCETKLIPKSTVYNFKGRSEKFDRALEAAKGIQEAKIIEGALKRTYSEKMSITSLAVNHNWDITQKNQTTIIANDDVKSILSQVSSTKNLIDE